MFSGQIFCFSYEQSRNNQIRDDLSARAWALSAMLVKPATMAHGGKLALGIGDLSVIWSYKSHQNANFVDK